MIGTGLKKAWLVSGPTDMRKSFDTLCGVVRSRMEDLDPLSGHLFVFCNRRRDRIKILHFDGTGLWVSAKRLEAGTFNWPEASERSGRCVLNQHELALLLGGLDLGATKRRRWWRRE